MIVAKIEQLRLISIEVILFFCEQLKENGFLDINMPSLDNLYQSSLKSGEAN